MQTPTKGVDRMFLWIVKIGLWVIPILPFYVASSMLFPFITGKNFTFRIIVELMFPFWVGLAIAYPIYRPRLTLLVKGVTVFVVVVFLADLLGPNPYRSFFSNYERMEGFMMLGHLYLYFLMLVSVFKTRRDWMVFFHISLLASLAVCYVALRQRLGYAVSIQGGFRVDGTIGNPTYLAAYLLFHVWLLALLMEQFWPRLKTQAWRWWIVGTYAAALLIELAIIYFTATRGVVLSLLAVGVPFLAVLVVWWHRVFVGAGAPDNGSLQLQKQNQQDQARNSSQGSHARSWSTGRLIAAYGLGIIVVLPLMFWLIRTTPFIQKSQVLNRLTNYSLNEATIKSRFMIWGMSWKGVLQRPLLGWGQENYYLVFQKYYNPGLYAQEPWFDRSHNIIFDWLTHAGFLGLASYLAVFVIAFWTIIAYLRKAVFSWWQGMILLALFTSYFLQNIFVFDNLNTYLLFFAFLAYTQYYTGLGQHSVPDNKTNARQNNSNQGVLGMPALAISIGCGVAGLVAVYTWNVLPIHQSQSLITSLRLAQTRGAGMDQIIGQFQNALSYHAFGDGEVREQLGNISRGLLGAPQFSEDDQKKLVKFTVEELRKETSKPAKDIKHLLFLASILDRSLALDPAYIQESEQILQEAAALSPTKQIIYFEQAQLYLSTNRVDKSIEVLRKAWLLDTRFEQAGANLLLAAILGGKQDVIKEVLAKLNLNTLDEGNLYRFALAYQRVSDFRAAAALYERLLKIAPNNAQYHATYAALLGMFGKIDEAKAHVKEASRLDPSFEKEGEQFIKSLGAQQRK